MIIYLIKAAVIHGLLWMIYWVFLKRENQYQTLRLYLIGSVLLACILPAVSISIPNFEPTLFGQVGPLIFLDEVVVGGATSGLGETTGLNWAIFSLKAVVWGGSGIFFMVMMIAWIRMMRIFREATPSVSDGIRVFIHPEVNKSFSFFSLIFLNTPDPSIAAHEQAHGKYLHSLDVLLLNLFRTMMWWLPTTWMALKEMKLIHEYQADAEVIARGNNIEEYRKLLISASMASLGWNLASSFHEGVLTKRLNAMKQTQKQISRWKIGMLGVLVAMMSVTFACNNDNVKEITDIPNMGAEVSQGAQELLNSLQAANPGVEFKVLDVVMNEGEDISDLRKRLADLGIPAYQIEAFNKDENKEAHEVIIRQGMEANHQSWSIGSEDEVYTMVDDIPEYPGGMENFYGFVMKAINYPEEARKAGIEGKVFIQFVVEKDGSVTHPEVVRGLHPEVDASALALFSKIPEKFVPGKVNNQPVRVQMVIPITYNLY